VAQYQHDALWCPQRYAIVDGSTKCGKTYPCILWIYEMACQGTGPNQNCWWVAPIFPQAEIAFTRLCTMLLQADPQKATWGCNKTKMTVTVRGSKGRTIWFKSADNPDSLYGEDVWAAVIDEATRCPEPSWHAVRSTLTATRGPVRIISNVRGRKNWVWKLGQRAKAGEEGMHYAKITAYDAVAAGVVAAAEIEDAKRIYPEQVFNELYLCIPSDDGGNPFGLTHIAKARRPIANPGPVYQRGVDLAKKQDYTVNVGLDITGQMVDFDRFNKLPWDETTTRVANSIGETPALVDSTGVGDAVVDNLLKRCPMVEGYIFSAPSKQKLMENLAVCIQSGTFIFDNDVMQAELEAFEYVIRPNGAGCKYSAPDGYNDDCVMAAALACYGAAMRPRPLMENYDEPNRAHKIKPNEVQSAYDEKRRAFASGSDDE